MTAQDADSGEAAHLADFLVQVLSTTNGRWARGDRRDRQQHTLLKVAEAIGILWQATVNTQMWNEFGHIHLGLLACNLRQHRVPGHYKRSLVYETRNHSGQGVTHPRQVLIGMRIGKRKDPSVLLNASQRKRHKVSACSRGAKSMASRSETFEMWNYWLDSRIGLSFQSPQILMYTISAVVLKCKDIV